MFSEDTRRRVGLHRQRFAYYRHYTIKFSYTNNIMYGHGIQPILGLLPNLIHVHYAQLNIMFSGVSRGN